MADRIESPASAANVRQIGATAPGARERVESSNAEEQVQAVFYASAPTMHYNDRAVVATDR